MPASSVLAFWGFAVALIAVPGPDWAFAISAGLRGHVVPAAGGIVLGYLAMTITVTAGVGVLITSTPVALTVLTVVGGLYLVWLGGTIYRRPAADVSPGVSTGGGLRTMLRGTAVSALNPKALLIFVTVLPRFTHRAAPWPLPAQLAVLGLTFAGTCGVMYLGVAGFATRLRHVRPGVSRLVSRVSGASMILIGTALLIDRL